MSTTASKTIVNSCAACTKAIRSTQCMQCSRCSSTYHAVCLNISDMRKISEDTRANYVCPLCKNKTPKSDNSNTPVRAAASASVILQPETASDHDRQEIASLEPPSPTPPCLSPSISTESEQLACLVSEIKLMRKDMRDMKSEMKYLSDNIASRLDEISTKCFELEKRDIAREAELCSLKSTVADLRSQLSARAQASLKNEVEISGISENGNENPIHIVRVTAQKIGITIDDSEIDYVMRVGPRHIDSSEVTSGSSKLPRPLVVRFVRRHVREDFIRAAKIRRNLSSSDIGVEGPSRKLYFDERLTQENRHLFRATRKRVSEIGFKFCWIRNGTIHVRKQEGNPAIAIKSTEDLDSVLSYRAP